MAMNILICGAGTIARELLKQLCGEWSVTLIDRSREVLEQAAALCPDVRKRYVEDGSSPVVLERAGLEEQQYVLAMTGSDPVNLAVCRFAREKGVPYVSALVHEPENAPGFQKLGVHVVMTGTLTARNLYHYLQDPRVHVSPLTGGMGNIYEVNAAEHFRVVGKRAAYFQRTTLRLAGIFRHGRLVFPHPTTVIQADDRLVLLGDTDIFHSVCSLLECASPHFPLAYGPSMLVALPSEGEEIRAVLQEGVFLGQNTKVRKVTLLCGTDRCAVDEGLAGWPQEVDVEVRPSGDGVMDRVRRFVGQGGCGLLLMPPVELSLFAALSGPAYTGLAHDLGCPVLIARRTVPYEKILVPFKNTPNAELALEVAFDLGKQLGAELSVMVVEEPGFLSGERDGEFLEAAMQRVRELAHVHKAAVREITATGNPVRAIVEETAKHDLVVIGSTNRDRGLISPNVGEHLARRAGCSTLIVTA
jgi:Trk K+ transport system NAD-binding subunit/nucleotide-binding universal stress UspA family protein